MAHCDFMKTAAVRNIFSENGDDDTMEGSSTSVSYGLFSHPFLDDDETFLGCIRYSSTSDEIDTDGDTKLHVGQTFSIFTILLLTVCCVLCTNSCVLGYKTEFSWKMAHRICICATITQMFTFFVLGSDRCTLVGGCSISRNGKVAIFNTVLLAGVSLSWFYLPPPATVLLKRLPKQKPSAIHGTSAKADPTRAATSHQQQGIDSYGNDWMMETIDETESVVSEDLTQSQNDGNNITESNQFCTNVQDNLYVRLAAIAVMIIGWIVSILGIQRCTLVLVGYTEDGNSGSSGLGLFSLAIQEHNDNANRFLGCVAYPEHAIDSLDGPFRTARAFGVVTTMITTSILVLGLAPLVVRCGIAKIWMALRIIVPLSIVTQPLAFVVFRSDVCTLEGQVDCRLGDTGKLVVCNILLYLLLVVFLFVVPPPSAPVFEMVSSDELENNCETKTSIALPSDMSPELCVQNKTPPFLETTRSLRAQNVIDHQLSSLSMNIISSPSEKKRSPHVENLSDHRSSSSKRKISPAIERMRSSHAENVSDHWSSFAKAHHSPPTTPPAYDRSILAPVAAVPKKANVGLDDDAPDDDDIASITIQVEYTSTEKKTRKITKYKDGSQTVSTTIEELCDMILEDDDDDDDHIQFLE